MNIESKSYLAKLLATEDIGVEHRNVPTAAFDLKSRTVILPNWKDMPDFLYDLFVGHEVGHALVTPAEGWHDAICREGSSFKGYLNVVEDARNERLVKQRYPGLAKSFYRGYQLLYKKGFFGQYDDVNELLLIDRINLHYKVGSFLNVQFTDEEKVFLSRIDNAVEWDEVETIAKELFELAKSQQSQTDVSQSAPTVSDQEADTEQSASGDSDEEGDEQSDDQSDDQSDGESESTESGESGESDEGEETEDGESTSSESTTEDGETEESDDVGSESDYSSDDSSDSVEEESDANESVSSLTDRQFRDNESRLLSSEDCPVKTVYFPKWYKEDYFVHSAEKVWDFEFNWNKHTDITNAEIRAKIKRDFMTRNRDAINQLVMQFEMKRKAAELKKTAIHNTGKLNEDKLWAYKLTEDLFLSNEVVPTGKNHGMFMLLDMSGSMNQHMSGTIEQLLIQVAFCKKVGIPFKVMGFTSCIAPLNDSAPRYAEGWREWLTTLQQQGDNILTLDDDDGLVELISSDLPNRLYEKIFTQMLEWKDCFTYTQNADYYLSYYDVPRHLSLGSTPLCQGYLLSIKVANEFKENNNIEVLSTIVLSDGGATDYLSVGHRHIDGCHKLIIKHGLNSVSTTTTSSSRWGADRVMLQQSAAAVFKQVTGSRMIQFWIETKNKKKMKDAFGWLTGPNDWYVDPRNFEPEYKKIGKEGFAEITNNAWGFDSCFLIAGAKNLDSTENELEVKSEKKGDLLRGFRQFQKKKTSSRQFINRFIDRVA